MLGLHFTPACVLLTVCSLHFTLSLHFTPGPQSAVRSQSLTLTVFFSVSLLFKFATFEFASYKLDSLPFGEVQNLHL